MDYQNIFTINDSTSCGTMEEIERIVQFLSRHKDFTKTILSLTYPFTVEELRQYSTKLNWYWISCNKNIEWTESLFSEFEGKINMEPLGSNESFPWTEKFIDEHLMDLFYMMYPEHGIVKTEFSYNPSLPWSEKFIEKYIEHWDWDLLSMNTNLPFTIELLEKFQDKWDYDSLEWNEKITCDAELRCYLNIFHKTDAVKYIHSCPYCYKGAEILLQMDDKLHSTDFCFCPNFAWTPEFATGFYKKVKYKVDKEELVSHISFNIFEHWSIEVLESFEDYWDYIIIQSSEELLKYLCSRIKEREVLCKLMLE